jgi:hypothetical protein
LAVPHVTRAQFAPAAADDGQPGIADQRTQLAIEDPVPIIDSAPAVWKRNIVWQISGGMKKVE